MFVFSYFSIFHCQLFSFSHLLCLLLHFFFLFLYFHNHILNNLSVKHQTRGQKVVSLNPGRSGRRTFFSRVNFVCWLLLGVCSTPVLPQWHIKDPRHSAKSAGGRLHLNMHTPSSQRSRSGLTMLSRHYVATYHWEKRSHAQLVREHSATVFSARWTIVGWSWSRKFN